MKSIIPQEGGQCLLCNLHDIYIKHTYLEEHHIFGGIANRKLSEKHGLKAKLCMAHHRGNQRGNKEAVHCNKEMDLMLKRFGQQTFEKTHSREEFKKIFGKSWL